MRGFRLALAGVLSATAFLLAIYWFERPVLLASYRCFKYVKPWYACYLDRPFEFEADFYGMRYQGNSANLIDRMVLYYGGFEQSVLHFLKDVMEANFASNGIFIDIGAHVGQHSLFMSRYSARVHAFEPYEPVLERFRRLVEINRVDNIVIHPVGLGARKEKLLFYEPPTTNTGTGSFVESFNPKNTPHRELEVVVGDEVLRDAKLPSVDLIKIDVEGYLKSVLEGLTRTLAEHRPIVVFEITIRSGESDAFQSGEALRSAFPEQYEFLAFQGNIEQHSGSYQLAEMDAIVSFTGREQYEIVAFPAERRDRIPRSNASKSP